MDGHTKGLQNRPRRLTGQNVRTQKINFYIFCFFIFVNLREGEKNPTKKIPKKKKKANTSGRTDGHTEGLQNWPRRLTGQNVRTQKINKFLYLHAGPVLPMN